MQINYTSPFFYVILHNPSNRYYAGYCSAKGYCNSEKFMTERGYKTSSKLVNDLILLDGLNSFSIEKIRHFETASHARLYESRFLCKVNAMRNIKFINQSNGGRNFYCKGHTIKTKLLLSELSKRPRRLSEEGRIRLSTANKGLKRSEESRNKMRKPKSTEHRKNIGLSSKGRKWSESAKNKVRGRTLPEETKIKLSKNNIGRFWWTNGVTNMFCVCAPDENSWRRGRTFHWKENIILSD